MDDFTRNPGKAGGAGSAKNDDAAVIFLRQLRPAGPWMLLAIDPESGRIEAKTIENTDGVRSFVAKHNGTRNLYYSLNPTRTRMGKKAAKTDIARIEYVPTDLDPKHDEPPEDAKKRYLTEIGKFKKKPTAVIDSGNGLNVIFKLAKPIELPEPVIAKGRRRPNGEPQSESLVFDDETQKVIADIEGRAAQLMKDLGSAAGTQNIDRILRLPGTTNLPTKKKLREGRVQCQAKLIEFGITVFEPKDFPDPVDPEAERAKAKAKAQSWRSTAGKKEPSKRLIDLLLVRDKGAGVKYTVGGYEYESRSGLLFGFLRGCIQEGISEDVIFDCCIGDLYAGSAIWEHCHDQAAAGTDPIDYLQRQLERTEEKYASSAVDAEIMRLSKLPWLEYEQQRKKAAEDLGIRVSRLDRMVEGIRKREQTEDDDDAIKKINETHALVLAGNKAVVMKFDEGTKFRLLQVSAFKAWFGNEIIGTGLGAIPLGDYWLTHKGRREYSGIEFSPTGSPTHAGFYNLWQGFAVEPRPGDCSKFLAHLKDNVARGNEEHFLWIVGWWAAIVQKPSEKMETALVIRGSLGTGKSKVGKVFKSLFGDHFQKVASARYITGQFNSHMSALLVLHSDEAFWAGNKDSVGTLRDLVTGDDHLIEHKGIDPIRVANHVRLFVTGNPDWMVPASFHERRWATFDISEDKMQDKAYFAAIDEEMDNGGREALLHHLLHFDLSQVDVRTIPKTAALLAQQIESMLPIEAWWHQMLIDGTLPPKPQKSGGPHICDKKMLFDRYCRHAAAQGITWKATETKVGMFLHDLLGAALKNPKLTIDGKRRHYFELPSLKECRQIFDKKLGQSAGWGEGWEEEDWHHDTLYF